MADQNQLSLKEPSNDIYMIHTNRTILGPIVTVFHF